MQRRAGREDLKHWRYLKYVVRHKWYVMLACFRRGLIWRGLKHDWSKFLPSEWFPYAESFYSTIPREKRDELREQCWKATGNYPWTTLATVKSEFDAAWLHHQHFNDHHWQHWVLREDSGKTKLLEMPWVCVQEMLADWEGAGRAIHGTNDTSAWYHKNRDNIQLHPKTRVIVEHALQVKKG